MIVDETAKAVVWSKVTKLRMRATVPQRESVVGTKPAGLTPTTTLFRLGRGVKEFAKYDRDVSPRYTAKLLIPINKSKTTDRRTERQGSEGRCYRIPCLMCLPYGSKSGDNTVEPPSRRRTSNRRA